MLLPLSQPQQLVSLLQKHLVGGLLAGPLAAPQQLPPGLLLPELLRAQKLLLGLLAGLLAASPQHLSLVLLSVVGFPHFFHSVSVFFFLAFFQALKGCRPFLGHSLQVRLGI